MADNDGVLDILLNELSSNTVIRYVKNVFEIATVAVNEVTAIGAVIASNNVDPVRVVGYVDDVVPFYSAPEFRSHFRMNRSSLEELCQNVAPYITMEKGIPLQKRMLATLWMLGNNECYRSVADRFELSKGSLHMTVIATCEAITKIGPQHVTFPKSRQELEVVANGFFQKSGLPGVVGAIDGTHIPIPGPQNVHRGSYINRKGFSSIQLQVVCDSNLKFLDTCAGWPGSVHDARVYRNSPLFEHIKQLPGEFHLIGDSAYPLSHNMLVPYRDNGHLDQIQRKFNKVHSSARADVERAIGLLKCKFRRLKNLEMHLQHKIPSVITACCILHNYIISKEGEDCDIEIEISDILNEDNENESNVEGVIKRQSIAYML